jgi:hypothetical protein
MRQEGRREFAVDIKGDNIASLSWLRKGRATSAIARRASIGLSLVLAHMNAQIGETTHVAGENNQEMDGLSRGKEARELGLSHVTMSPHLGEGTWAWKYLVVCAPNMNGEERSGGIDTVRELLELLHVLPSPSPIEQSKL